MSDFTNGPHSRRGLSRGIGGERVLGASGTRWGGFGPKQQSPSRCQPTVTGCRYDDLLWKLEFLCEEALARGLEFAAILPLFPERVELPVDDQIVLAEAQRQGVRVLINAVYEFLGEKPEALTVGSAVACAA